MALSSDFVLQVLAADDARYQAMVTGDSEALEKSLSDQLAYTHSSGYRDDKANYMASVRGGKVRYLTADRTEATVEQLGETAAIMHGSLVLSVSIEGREKKIDCLFSSVWERNDGVWQLRLWTSINRA